jgi:hypothetical protein
VFRLQSSRAGQNFLRRAFHGLWQMTFPGFFPVLTFQPISNQEFLSQTIVLADVQRFDSSLGKAATIDAHWIIKAKRDANSLTGRTFIREPVTGNGYDALMAAHGRALAAVSREIAETVKKNESMPSINMDHTMNAD